jgi:stage II sporulation protein D
VRRAALPAAAALLAAGCAGGPPIHTAPTGPDVSAPAPGQAPPRHAESFDGVVEVRIGLHWEGGTFEIASGEGLRVDGGGARVQVDGGRTLVAAAGSGGSVRLWERGGRVLRDGPGPVAVVPVRDGDTVAGGRRMRGRLELTARADTLFVVNVLGLEDYLRGVVPREIGPRPAAEAAAVAAQAVAARTYTVKRLEQYNSLPFDLYADVQDQVYHGIDDENAVADGAVLDTRGLILAEDGGGPIEAYYSSTCGGRRADIAVVWPHREVFPSLRGGADGVAGHEWCRTSPHFAWTESWTGTRLGELVRRNVPGLLELPPGSVRGELVDLRVVGRGPSGRIGGVEYVTTAGSWTVPGDQNRWVLRRPGGGILRSVLVELDVERRGGRVVRVTARGHGNGHGVGMCQTGAIGRAQAGQDFRTILRAYYPGAKLRSVRGDDLPGGRASAS